MLSNEVVALNVGYFSRQTIFFLKELHKINTYIIHWHLVSCTKLHVVSWCINLLWKKKLKKKINKKILNLHYRRFSNIHFCLVAVVAAVAGVTVFFSVTSIWATTVNRFLYFYTKLTQRWWYWFYSSDRTLFFFCFFFEKPTKTIKHTINHNYRHKKSP